MAAPQDPIAPSQTAGHSFFLSQETAGTAMDSWHRNSIGPLTSARQKSDKLMSNLRMPLLLFTDDEADTLVYIDAAESEKAQQHRWAPLSQSNSNNAIPQRMHSRKILGAGSPVLNTHFEPRKQARVRRRYGLTNNMPAGITYVIDLTPPSEGEDAVIFMTELSCPLGVRKWAQYATTWKLPSPCVNGQDEVEWLTVTEPEPEPLEILPLKKKKSSPGKEHKKKQPAVKEPPPRVLNWNGNLPTLREDPPEKKVVAPKVEKLPPRVKKVPGLPLDYSPIRHRTCLERILHALEELNPELDTPPKLWTFFALAKILGVAENPLVGDHIVAWLYAGNNPLFVEINPELAYKIACGLKNIQLCQDSFAILVGEEALSLLNSSVQGQIPKRAAETMHGRTREHLDDTEIQRIEYASKTFLDKMLNKFVELAGNEMLWLDKLVRRHIKGRLEPRHKSIVDDFVKFCKDCVRDGIYRVLRETKPTMNSFDYPIGSDSDYPNLRYRSAMDNIPFICRILTRTFWKSLQECSIYLDGTSRVMSDHWHTSLKELAPMLPNLKHQDSATIRWISGLEYANTERRFHINANNFHGIDSTWSSAAMQEYLDMHPDLTDIIVRFESSRCEKDISYYLSRFADRVTSAFTEFLPRNDGVRFEMVDTLVSLGEEELKFLPLWAGGNDDDTGGVFVDHDLPIVEYGGFSTAGPSIHTGSTVPSEDSMSSFDSIRPDDAVSTIQRASHEATDSQATTTVRSAFSMASSSFEIVGGVRGMDIQSDHSIADDMDYEMGVPDDVDDFVFDCYDDDNDNDDANDTIGDSDGELV
jgi:hypothetical protein